MINSKNSTNTVYSYDEKFYGKEDVDRTIRIGFFQLYRSNHLQKRKQNFIFEFLFKYIPIIISRNFDLERNLRFITCCFRWINFSRERKSFLNIFEYPFVNSRRIHSGSSGQTRFKFVQENSPTGLEIIRHNS